MNVYSKIPGCGRLASIPVLSRRARQRLKWFDYYRSHNQNARLTCRYFGISTQTFYRWKRRYDPRHIDSLEDRSNRPRHVRQPTYSVKLVAAVLKLREEYPRWGKDKLVILLRREGFTCSASTVGRILKKLRERGIKLFVLPPRSPKLNGHVERAQRTHTEEFYEVTNTSFETAELNQTLLEWERVYNTVRPHQALGYLTPEEFLMLRQQNRRKEEVSLSI